MLIDRCVCANLRFSDLRELARRIDARALAHLQEHVPVGQRCGLCRPYVRRMLETGEVAFTTLISDDRPGTDAG